MDDHQRMNALQMQDAGGGICLDENKIGAAVLLPALCSCWKRQTLSKMAKSAVTLPTLMPPVDRHYGRKFDGCRPNRTGEPQHE